MILFDGLTGEPVTGVPKEVVAHLAIVEHLIGPGQIPKAQDDGDIDFARRVFPSGDTVLPGLGPFLAKFIGHCLFKPLDDGLQNFFRVFDQRKRIQMLVEIGGLRRADAERMNFRTAQAEQIVEPDRLHPRRFSS